MNKEIHEAKHSYFPKKSAKTIRDIENILNEVKDSKKIAIQETGYGGTFEQELSFGYKYFLGPLGLRLATFINYQFGRGGLNFSDDSNDAIFLLNCGFNTDLLINWINDELDGKSKSWTMDTLNALYNSLTGTALPANLLDVLSKDHINVNSSGLVIGMDIGASTWILHNNLIPFNQVKSRTIFQFSGKFGMRWNTDKYVIYDNGYKKHAIFKGGVSVELGVKVPAFGVNYYSDAYGNKLDYKRVVSVYLNCAYTFKN
nr:outer membrane beta-barrel protein [Helicobacter pylori]